MNQNARWNGEKKWYLTFIHNCLPEDVPSVSKHVEDNVNIKNTSLTKLHFVGLYRTIVPLYYPEVLWIDVTTKDVLRRGIWVNIPATKATHIPTIQEDIISLVFNSRTVQRSFIERLNRLTLPLSGIWNWEEFLDSQKKSEFCRW
jgi:hypothetical protein